MAITIETSTALKAYFAPASVKWRIGTVIYNSTDETRGVKEDTRKKTTGPLKGDKGVATVLAYLNTELVKERLDAVLGPDGWANDTTAVTTKEAEIMTAKCVLTIGGVSRSDIGDAGNNEKSKGAFRDALKRAANLFGVGAYLATLGEIKANVVFEYGAWRIADSEKQKLIDRLPGGVELATVEMVDILCAFYGVSHEAHFKTMTKAAAFELITKAKPYIKPKATAA